MKPFMLLLWLGVGSNAMWSLDPFYHPTQKGTRCYRFLQATRVKLRAKTLTLWKNYLEQWYSRSSVILEDKVTEKSTHDIVWTLNPPYTPCRHVHRVSNCCGMICDILCTWKHVASISFLVLFRCLPMLYKFIRWFPTRCCGIWENFSIRV
jgi:hypothetical protein